VIVARRQSRWQVPYARRLMLEGQTRHSHSALVLAEPHRELDRTPLVFHRASSGRRRRPLWPPMCSRIGICGHTERLTTAMLTTAGIKPDRKVQDLGSRRRCRDCDEKGRAVISIRWATV